MKSRQGTTLLITAALGLVVACEATPEQEAAAPTDKVASVEQQKVDRSIPLGPASIEPPEEHEAPDEDRSPELEREVAEKSGLLKALGAKDTGNTASAFDKKMNVAMSGEGDALVIGGGIGSMGLRGSGSGGGGEGYGRIGGLGKVTTGGKGGSMGYGSASLGKKAKLGARRDVSGSVDRSRVAPRAPEPKPVIAPSTSNTDAEQYTDHGVNPMTSTAKDKFSTFSVDVDTGSYTVTRRKLNEGVNVPASSVRVEEFVNYFGYDYPSPDAGAFGVHLEAAPSPFDPSPDRVLLRVGVQGKTVSAADRKPVHLTFLVDVSGSMNRPDKLGLAKTSLKTMVDRLGAKDSVALVTYAGSNRVVLKDTRTTKGNKATIKKAIDDLRSGGGTAMSSGMELAYKQAIATVEKGHVSRVLVMSDGDANIGPSSHSQILNQIKAYVDEGVTLSTIGFGMGNYKDTLMEQLSNKGNGNYYYIDSVDEARKVFGEQADGTLEVIAKDVKIQVEFNPDAVASYRLVGYENRDIADEDFRNDAVDAGEIGAGHTVTAFYEVVLTGKSATDLGYVRIRAKKPDGYQAAEQIFTWRSAALKTKLSDASRDFQFASAVVTFAEKLRESPYAEGISWGLIEEVAKASAAVKKDRLEFLGLVKKAKALRGG